MQHIWTFNFLEVVRQHISGVMSNVIQFLVANLADF